MIKHEGIDRNFKFMILEVIKQLEKTYQLIENPTRNMAQKILSGDNYIDILKSIIEKKCISFFRHAPRIDKQSADLVSAINIMSSNLERIADLCVNIAKQMQQIDDQTVMKHFNYSTYYVEIREALAVLERAGLSQNSAKALRVCHSESRLNDLYRADFQHIKEQLRHGQKTDDLLVALHVLHNLERIGDALLNVGEAMLLAATGEKLKLHEYLALNEALQATGSQSSVDDLSLDFRYETRSGSKIGRVADKFQNDPDTEAIFKKGNVEKIFKEKENIERWTELMPGVPPRVLELRQTEGDASLLLEYLDGLTFQDVALSAEMNTVERAQSLVQQTLETVWKQTIKNETVQAGYVNQVMDRIDDIQQVHPEFTMINGQSPHTSPLNHLLEQARSIEQSVSARFSVLIHGDLNTDNIIYNHRTDQIHFIDLYRSRMMDYVQDVSVFMVSNFRLPVFEPGIRRRLNEIILRFYEFARQFARQHDDRTFEARLALGLIRSFLTSTRFELTEDFAKVMYLRAVSLMEQLIQHTPQSWEDFELQQETLTYRSTVQTG
jgi:phosphate uptake regulator